jgi:hypothetical protein
MTGLCTEMETFKMKFLAELFAIHCSCKAVNHSFNMICINSEL